MNSFYRRGPLALAFLVLCGCNSLTATSIETINLAIKGDLNKIPLDKIAAVPGESLFIKADDAEGLYVKQAGNNGLVNWLGLNENLQTDHGRLTQLVGIGDDVFVPLVENDPFLRGLDSVPDGTQVVRAADYPLAYQTGLQQYATYKKGPLERIQILDQLVAHQRIDELIWMPQLHYRATNYYWLDLKSGQIRRSIQHLTPELPPFDMTVVRPSALELPQ